ncbi:Type II secretion system (T2SS), protein E, N-terminal domain [Trichlorobacter thiogenes]|uniref:Type II secretion system (T2SS), protein E, N-terminal domain n=1 Tax=Trichlorobacter thiogenes TaxID=115783 RepID=A0A1T4QU37_9BACT|nr:response regulator [Trichlorobacter thiogenes]SKA06971.1 Type II secretion system (T2SS), protein E, N-terminal domain [Trichlorobacter thiogenes]
MSPKKLLGEILVNKGILSPVTVERMSKLASSEKKRFGWFLEDRGLITGNELSEALAEQFNIKHLPNIAQYSYSKQLLALITPETALEFNLFPLRQEGNNLLMAVTDPTDMKMANNIAKNQGMTIVPAVVSRKEFFAAFCKHYLGREVQQPKEKTVLIADDDKLTREMLKEILTSNGFRVLLAADGMEAYKEIVASRPQVVLTDKVMPNFDGFQLIKLVKAIHDLRSIPIILISDKTTDDDEARLFELGFFDFMSKPIKAVTLVSRVKRAMGISGDSTESTV